MLKVQWVSNKIGVLIALVNSYNAVITHLENVMNEKGNDVSMAKGIADKMKNLRFILMLHFLFDFLLLLRNSLLFSKKSSYCFVRLISILNNLLRNSEN